MYRGLTPNFFASSSRGRSSARSGIFSRTVSNCKMGLLLGHADRLADLVLRVALAINAELLREDLLDSPAVLVRPLHNFLCKGYPMRLAKLDLPFSCPRPQIVLAMGVFTVGEKRDKRPNSRLKTRSVDVRNSGTPTYISTNSTNSNDDYYCNPSVPLLDPSGNG